MGCKRGVRSGLACARGRAKHRYAQGRGSGQGPRFEVCESRVLLSASGNPHRPHGAMATPSAIIIAPVDVINGTPGNDVITLKRNAINAYDDWTLSGDPVTYQVLVNDPNGLTINGLGGNDVINLDYTNGNPLPNIVHFNGSFTVNGLSGVNPLANTNFEVGQSTLYFAYTPGASPVAVIGAALQNGFNGGAWNGSSASVGGSITSTAAAGGPAGVFGVGFADSVDGVVSGQPANTVEVRYTVMGDANLDRVVNSTDAVLLGRNYLAAGKSAWDQGNFNFDSTISFADAQILQKNFSAVARGSAVGVPATASTDLVNTALDSGADEARKGRIGWGRRVRA